jgi:hypothetical protein
MSDVRAGKRAGQREGGTRETRTVSFKNSSHVHQLDRHRIVEPEVLARSRTNEMREGGIRIT